MQLNKARKRKNLMKKLETDLFKIKHADNSTKLQSELLEINKIFVNNLNIQENNEEILED